MVEIECLTCRKIIKMQQYIDTEKYDGQVVCEECKSTLYIKLAKGKVQKYKIVEKQSGPITLKFVPAQKAGHRTQEEGDTAKDNNKEDRS